MTAPSAFHRHTGETPHPVRRSSPTSPLGKGEVTHGGLSKWRVERENGPEQKLQAV
jgi:hypothetical protein